MRTKDDARKLFLQESFGILSTISLDPPGYPFGSVAPYSVDGQGRPVVYISTIAQHTKNILTDPRVSLTVVESSGDDADVQAKGRVTVLANAVRLEESEVSVRERYFRYFASARQYDGTHDFMFFRLDPVRVRFIGGFGQIYWVEPAEFAMTNPFSAPQEARIIDHMNADHGEALKHYAGGSPATMAGIDSEGFDILVAGVRRRVPFAAPVRTMDEARQALVAMAKRPA